MEKQIRTLIADNDTQFATNLKLFLDAQSDIKVIDLVRDGHGAISASKEARPDLVVMDLHLPVVDSVRAVQSIIEDNELARILVVSAKSNDRYAIEAIKAGASGYVFKNGAGTNAAIAGAIRQIIGGEVVINSTLASDILREFSTNGS
jgi:DNA-binding NarL/FixJ family response regulator